MAFKGTLDTLGTIEVLQVIHMTRKTGCLGVTHPSGEAKHLYFEDGDITAATSTAPKDRLGALLVKLGMLSAEQLEVARRDEQRTGIKQGASLLEQGLLTEEHALASDPWIRAVLEVILADEVAHAKLGWQFVGAVAPTLDAEARARTSAYLRVAFAYLVEKELPLLPVSPPLDDVDVKAREAAGLCSGASARRIFFDTLTRVVVPSLEALGFDAARAWQTRADTRDA
jgi:hypothetical protein